MRILKIVSKKNYSERIAEMLISSRRLGVFRNYDIIFIPEPCSILDAESHSLNIFSRMITVKEFFSMPDEMFSQMKTSETFWLKNEYENFESSFMDPCKDRFIRSGASRILHKCEDIENDKFGFLIKTDIFFYWKNNISNYIPG